VAVDRRPGRGVGPLALVFALGALGFVFLAAAGTNRVALAVGVVLGFLAGWGWPGMFHLVVVRSSTAEPGLASGFVLRGVFLGAIVGPPLFATIAEASSYGVAWAAAAVVAAIGAVLVLVTRQVS